MRTNLLLVFVVLVCSIISYAQEINGTWHGSLDINGQKIRVAFHVSKDGGTMDIPQQGVRGVPVNLSLLTQDSISLNLPTIGMSYNGKRSHNKIKGIFNQNGIFLPMDLEPGDIDKPKRPQEPLPPFDYRTEEISFSNDNANAIFSGTLTYPIGYTPNKRIPVVLMVTGSGPQDRNEEVFEHKPFLVIADYLAKNGIASLRYDDRGVGKSTGERSGCTSKDYAEDAECGLQWLETCGKFSRIGILGHSEGGLIAFMLGAKGKADFIVSMAGPGIKGDTLLAEQQNAALKIYGQPANRTVESVRNEIKAQSKDNWVNYFINYDPTLVISSIKIPVMAINGSNDMQVISASNLNAIKKLLSRNNKKNFFKEYMGLNHLFQHCQIGNSLDYYNIEETCSLEVLQDVVDWINSSVE